MLVQLKSGEVVKVQKVGNDYREIRWSDDLTGRWFKFEDFELVIDMED
jgi:hypothetical protein